MRFWESVIWCFGNFATFSGRAGRHEFWWFATFCAIAALGLAELATEAPALTPLAGLLGASLLLPLCAVCVRRLHDIGMPGQVGLIVLVPVLGAIVLAALLGRRGEAHENRFGGDPRFTFLGVTG